MEALIIAVVAASVGSWLIVMISRKILDVIDKGMNGEFYKKGWVKKTGVTLDTLLPILPCIPSGFLAMAIMSFWSPDDVIWDNSLLYFVLGAVAGSIASQLYYTIIRGIGKRAERLLEPPTQTPTS